MRRVIGVIDGRRPEPANPVTQHRPHGATPSQTTTGRVVVDIDRDEIHGAVTPD